MVVEIVLDGFRGLSYVYFGAFVTYDGINEVGARAGEFVCELEGLFCDSVVREEFRTGSTEGTMAWFYSVVFSTYLYGDIGGGAFPTVFAETRWFERVFSLSFQLNFNRRAMVAMLSS